jgi:adenylate cyclase
MSQTALQFGSFILDLDRLCLRGPAGEIDLRPKSFEVLRYMVQHSGRVVAKDELMATVWSDVTVTDDSLTRCISEVRRAIGDEGQRILKTVPRRGYLLDAPVIPDRNSATAAAGETARSRVPRGERETDWSEAADLTDGPFIAVLPFANLSGNVEEDYFSDGFTEDIITELSRLSELRVIARHSSFQYKGKVVDVRQVGRDLGVRYVLEGSVRRSGYRIRVIAQMVDAASGAQRWAERWDSKLEDVFAIQDEVVRTLASLLIVHVRKAEVERALLKPPATWQAYEYFIRGLDVHLAYQSSQDVAALHEARLYLEHAISSDPAYARPYSALAISHLSSWSNFGDQEFLQSSALERAYQYARKAVQLDPQLAYGQVTFAWVLTWRSEHDAALSALDRALRLHPSYSHWQIAGIFMFAGEFDRAVETMKTYMRLDPYHPTSAIGWLGVTHFALGHLAEAQTLLREAVARSPNRAMFHYWLAATLGQMGDAEAARRQATMLLKLQPSFTITGTARRLAVFRRADVAEGFLEGLLKSGLPK